MTDTIITANKSAKRVWMRDFVNHRIADRGLRMVGDYVTAHTKSTFECADGHQWDVMPNSVLRGVGCSHCTKNAKLTKEIVNERISDRGLRMVGEYVNAITKSTFGCADGHRWDARPDSVMHRSGCPFCSGRRRD